MHQRQIRDVTLTIREYLPDVPVPQMRTLLFLHGVCEHGGRYAEFARLAVSGGWRVLIPDQRGHGLSSGIRTHVRHLDEYFADLEEVLRNFANGGTPVTLVGHSFGGLLVLLGLLRSPGRFRGGVALSPAVGVGLRINAFVWLAGQFLCAVWPTARFKTGIRAKQLTSDPATQEQRRNDPLLQRTVTCGWFFAMQLGLQTAWRPGVRWDQPLLVLQGLQDTVVDPQATEQWVREHGGPLTTLQLFPDGLHELLQAPHQTEVTAHLLNWLEQHA